jgi:exosortase
MQIKEYLNRRNILFFLFIAVAFLMAYAPIKAIYTSSANREYYSHIVLIPIVSIYLIFLSRKVIFSQQNYSFIAGIPTLLIGILLYFAGRFFGDQFNQNDFTAIIALSTVIFINGAFILCFGMQAFKAALFPLFFLIFLCPIPSSIMEEFIYLLQIGSTEFSNLLFMATGVPILREGFVFHLPGMSVEVAKQCSGIRSALALFITALLAGHLFLNTWWKKVILVLCIFPIAMFKNGIRIVSLTLLGTYVDPRVLQSSLHREGGIPFFIVALLLMAPILYFLRKSEKGKERVRTNEP